MRRPPYRLAGTLVAVAALLAFGALIFVPLLLHPNLSNAELGAVPDARTRITLQQAQAQLQNDTRATLLQSFAGLVLVAGALATWRQVHISRHAQITDRMTRAVDQTASDNVHVRVSGIYALERIHKDSQEDRQTITRILTAFIRIRAPWTAPPQWTHRHDTPALDNGMLRLGLRPRTFSWRSTPSRTEPDLMTSGPSTCPSPTCGSPAWHARTGGESTATTPTWPARRCRTHNSTMRT